MSSKDLAAYNPTCKFENLKEDLFIPQWVRDDIAKLRQADKSAPDF